MTVVLEALGKLSPRTVGAGLELSPWAVGAGLELEISAIMGVVP